MLIYEVDGTKMSEEGDPIVRCLGPVWEEPGILYPSLQPSLTLKIHEMVACGAGNISSRSLQEEASGIAWVGDPGFNDAWPTLHRFRKRRQRGPCREAASDTVPSGQCERMWHRTGTTLWRDERSHKA